MLRLTKHFYQNQLLRGEAAHLRIFLEEHGSISDQCGHNHHSASVVLQRIVLHSFFSLMRLFLATLSTVGLSFLSLWNFMTMLSRFSLRHNQIKMEYLADLPTVVILWLQVLPPAFAALTTSFFLLFYNNINSPILAWVASTKSSTFNGTCHCIMCQIGCTDLPNFVLLLSLRFSIFCFEALSVAVHVPSSPFYSPVDMCVPFSSLCASFFHFFSFSFLVVAVACICWGTEM